MGKVIEMDHPLIRHKLGVMRDKRTGVSEFHAMVTEISTLMCYEATRDLKTEEIKVETPICETTVERIKGKKLALVPILRAGLGMVDGILSLIPAAKVGHIGIYRDSETGFPVEYYCKLPADCAERDVYLLDPLLATGVSTSAAIGLLKEKGIRHIRMMCILASPEGIERLQKDHPEVDIYVAQVDECLDSNGYIVPGIGDAGDRMFGTK